MRFVHIVVGILVECGCKKVLGPCCIKGICAWNAAKAATGGLLTLSLLVVVAGTLGLLDSGKRLELGRALALWTCRG